MFASIGLPTSGADTAVGERERPEFGVGGVWGCPGSLCVGGGSRCRARLLWWRWRMSAASLAVVSSSSILCVIRVHRVGGSAHGVTLNWVEKARTGCRRASAGEIRFAKLKHEHRCHRKSGRVPLLYRKSQ